MTEQLTTAESLAMAEQPTSAGQLNSNMTEPQATAGQLTTQELQSLQILAFFFYQTGAPQSAKRAVKSILAVDPKNFWAHGLAILCENSLENYECVLALTEDLEEFAAEPKWQHSLLLLRARALEKTQRHDEARLLLDRVTTS